MLSDGGRDFVSGQRPGLNVEPLASAILSPLIGERTVTNRWEVSCVNWLSDISLYKIRVCCGDDKFAFFSRVSDMNENVGCG